MLVAVRIQQLPIIKVTAAIEKCQTPGYGSTKLVVTERLGDHVSPQQSATDARFTRRSGAFDVAAGLGERDGRDEKWISGMTCWRV